MEATSYLSDVRNMHQIPPIASSFGSSSRRAALRRRTRLDTSTTAKTWRTNYYTGRFAVLNGIQPPIAVEKVKAVELAFPVLNLVVVFIIRELADGRGELDRAGGLLNLAAEIAGERIEPRG